MTESFDPSLDLTLVKESSLKPEQIWSAWTQPELLMPWFCPRPWRVSECRIDLRPGGEFFTVMEGPDGERFAGASCYLEVQAPHRLVWTNALEPGFRPKPSPEPGDFRFTCELSFEPTDSGSIYRARLFHATEADRQTHESMGFEAGWGAAFDQLVALMSGVGAAD